MAEHSQFSLKVFYLWNPLTTTQHDIGFGHDVEWDVPLLQGYGFEFVGNASRRPGSGHFFGIRNPKLHKRLESWQPDAALLIGYRYASLLKMILTPKARRTFPLILKGDSHRLVGEGIEIKSVGRRKIIAAIFERFSACLYVGQANRDYFRKHGVSEDRLFFSPHAVDNERFTTSMVLASEEGRKWRTELGISPHNLLLLFAGKFEEKKRPLDLLEAFVRLQRSDVSLLFVGAGKLEVELRRKAGQVPNVFFAPFQNQTAIPRAYAACDLFVLPSFGPEESWGLAVNEAMCLSKPVVVSSHVGCGSDLVREGENGLIFEAGDVGALTSVLQTALSDRKKLQRWGEESRRIVADYNYANATLGVERALEFVTSRGRAKASTPNLAP